VKTEAAARQRINTMVKSNSTRLNPGLRDLCKRIFNVKN
jgi:hypothetical protein